METCTFGDKMQAVLRRLRIVVWKEKVRICLKLLLRLFGVRKCLFLGGYRREEDVRQSQQDAQLSAYLREHDYHQLLPEQSECTRRDNTTNLGKFECFSEYPQNNFEEYIVQKMQNILREKESYIALVVEDLDQGGLEKVVQMLAIEYQARELPVKVLCVGKGGRIADELLQRGIEVVTFQGNRRLLRKYLQYSRPFVANTHYLGEAMEEFYGSQIPIVEVIHNMYVFLSPDRIALERRKTGMVSKYIAVSEASATIFNEKILLGKATEITVVTNAVKQLFQEDNYQQVRKQIRKRYGISEDAVVYLAAGSIDSRKNQIGMLRAWDIVCSAGCGNAAFIIAGEATDYEYENKVKQLLSERSLEKSVIFTGFCKDMENLMKAADVFIMDSYYEGSSLAAMEALQSGLVLIHSACGSGAELAANGKNGLLIDNPLKNIVVYDSIRLYDAMHSGINENIEQLAASIMKVQNEIEEWRLKRDERKAYACEYSSVHQMVEQYLGVYLDVYEQWNNKGIEGEEIR